MTPSWYDVLDLDASASEAEVRLAWKTAIADLDPSDRRFRLSNQAAEVLLDPQRRAAHDAQLAADVEPTSRVDDRPEDSLVTKTGATAVGGSAPRAGPTVPAWLLAALAVTLAVAVAGCAYLWNQSSPESVEDSTRAAQAAAETAIVPILSYDAGRLEESGAAARQYMTGDYRTKYDQLFSVIEENAPGTGTVVAAEVIATGIVRSGEERVSVLLFVNRPTTNKEQQEPVVYRDQVTVTMELDDGEWLVDDLLTTPAGG